MNDCLLENETMSLIINEKADCYDKQLRPFFPLREMLFSKDTV